MAMKVIKDTLLKLVLMLSVVFVVSCEEYLPDGDCLQKNITPVANCVVMRMLTWDCQAEQNGQPAMSTHLCPKRTAVTMPGVKSKKKATMSGAPTYGLAGISIQITRSPSITPIPVWMLSTTRPSLNPRTTWPM